MGLALLNRDFAIRNQIPLIQKEHPIPLEGFDGAPSSAGSISEETVKLELRVASHHETISMNVTRIAHADLMLGMDWLERHNPLINWSERRITFDKPLCLQECNKSVDGNQSIAEFALFPRNPTTGPTESKLDPTVTPVPKISISFVSAAAFRRSLKDSQVYVMNLREADPRSLKIAAAAEISRDETPPPPDIPSDYGDFHDVFSKEGASRLPERRPYDHNIPLEEGKKPPFGRLYSMSHEELKALQDYLQENLSLGFIRASKSPAGAPVLFAKKKDGSLRLCVDYRGLNAITIKNRHPLPLISESLDRLAGAKYFTKFDLRSAYTHIRIAEGDEWKTAFRTRYGHFEYLVMPFGLTNAPASFQGLMNEIFRDIMDVFVIIYLDDILIFSSNLSDHREHVREVLRRLQSQKLFVKPEKCTFHVQEVEYLGFIVSTSGIKMDPAKISAIKDWPEPTSVRDIQVFLGFANFYRRFISSYSKTIAPLTALLKKDAGEWRFPLEAREAFVKLKEKFVTTPILTHYDPLRPIVIETDASDIAIGAVCSHMIENRLHPIAYHSRKLNPAELNYEIHDKELLAIIEAFKIWRAYIEGSQFRVDVFCDHNNLRYFGSSKVLSRRQTRWSQFLNAYNYLLHYRPGNLNGKPDALSRRPDLLKGGRASESEAQTVIPLHRFAVQGVRLADISLNASKPSELLERIKAAYSDDPILSELLPLLKDRQLPRTIDQRNRLSGLTLKEDLVLHNGLVYVPDNDALKVELLKHAHDSPSGGHYGTFKTYEVLTRDYHWPKMRRYIQEYCSTCDTCARSKPIRHAPYGQLNPLPVATGPWTSISLDHIVALPLTPAGFDAILVVVDRFTKRSHFVVAKVTDNAADLARQFIAYVFKHHGLPLEIASDRGTLFLSEFWRCLCEILRITPNYSVAFHPQSDGQTERTNQNLETYLRCFISYQQDDWDDLLPFAEFAYNNTVHSATGVTPFFAEFGRHPVLTITPSIRTRVNSPEARDFALHWEHVHEDCRQSLTRAQERMRQYYDRNHREAPVYSPGDKVWLLRRRQHDTLRPNLKLDYKRIGPLEVLEIVGSSRSSYRLRLPPGDKAHDVFSVVDLEPYKVNTIPGREIPVPPPTLVGNRRYYEVEDVLDSRVFYGKLQYRFHWTGYAAHQATWEPLDEPDAEVQAMIDRFHRKYPDKPGPHNLQEILEGGQQGARPTRRRRR